MKIAIITSAFFESTFPLIREMLKGHEVHLYCILSPSFLNAPNFDIGVNYNGENGFLSTTEKEKLVPKEISAYFNHNIDFLKLVIAGDGSRKLLKNLGKEINSLDYDIIHLIGVNLKTGILLSHFKNKSVIISLHEVEMTRTLSKTPTLKNLAKRILFKLLEIKIYNRPDTRFILFSKNEFEKLISKNINPENCKILKFGLFNVFNEYNGKVELIVPEEPYFLFFGQMKKYKGIDLFFKVAKKLEKLNIKFVAAGNDDDGFLSNEIEIPTNLTVIPRYLTDNEISFLIKKSKALIMPYRSASQSGIPPTAFAFGKPVISSNIAGVNEYLIHDYNSFLFNEYNAESLANSILRISRPEIYNRLVGNIKIDPLRNGHSIKTIAASTIKEYEKALK